MEQKISDLQKRYHRVIEYIYDHLDGDLSLDVLAEVACYSRFHWHRVYHNKTGETIAQTVRRLRFARAANELVQSEKSHSEIAKICGFPSIQSFSHGFRAEMGMSPSVYRQTGKAQIAALLTQKGNSKMYEIKTEEFKTRRVVMVEHMGSYMGIGQKFERLAGIVFSSPEILESPVMMGVYYSDPSSTPEKDLKSAACMEIKDGVEAPKGTVIGEIAGGKYAVLTHEGDYTLLSEAYRWLYGTWLPESGVIPREEPPVEIYLNSPTNTKPADLRTKICLPII